MSVSSYGLLGFATKANNNETTLTDADEIISEAQTTIEATTPFLAPITHIISVPPKPSIDFSNLDVATSYQMTTVQVLPYNGNWLCICNAQANYTANGSLIQIMQYTLNNYSTTTNIFTWEYQLENVANGVYTGWAGSSIVIPFVSTDVNDGFVLYAYNNSTTHAPDGYILNFNDVKFVYLGGATSI